MCISYCLLLIYTFSAVAAALNSHYEKAVISFKASEFDVTKIHLKNSLSQAPNHLPSRVLNAQLLLALGKASEAKIELKKAENGGADKIYLAPYLMDALLQQRKFDEVLRFVDEHLNVYNQSINNNFLLYQAQALVGKHSYSKADRVFAKVLKNSPLDIKAILGRAQVALKRGKFLQSMGFINEAMKIDGNHINVLMMSAVVNQISGEVDIAMKHVQQVLRMNPKSSPARLIYSVLLFESGELLAAKDELEQILNIVPNEPGANFLKYLTSVSLGRIKESEKIIAHLTNVLDSIPEDVQRDFPIFYYLSSLVNFQQESYNKAEIYMVKYLEFNQEDYKARKLHAKIAIAQKNFISAESILARLVVYPSTDIETISLFGKVLMLLGKHDKAKYYFEQVLKMQPNAIESTVNLAKLHLLNSQYKQVISQLSIHEQLNENTDALLLLSKSYLEIDKPKIALIHINTLQRLLPNDSYIHQLKGSTLGLAGDIANARISYQRAMFLSPENSQALIHLARIDVFQNKIDDAIEKLTAQNEKFGQNSAVLIELGDVHLSTKNIDSAKTMYVKALSVNPSSFLALTRLVSLYQKQKNIRVAIKITESFLVKNKEKKEAYAVAGALYYKNKETKKAISALTKAVKYNVNKEVGWLAVAKLQLRLGLLGPAKQSLIKALAWNNEFLPAYDKLIAIVISEKNKEQALKFIKQLQNLTGHVAKIDLFKGDLYSKLGELDKAKNHYQQSLDKEVSQQAILGLYRIYKRKNDNKKIVLLLSSWQEKHPDDLVTAIALAETYHDMGQHQFALNFYLALLNRFPNNPILLNNIALVYLSVKQINKADELAGRAHDLLPQSVTVLDTKAWIEISRGNYKKALGLLRIAYTLEHNNGAINYHIAIALGKLGRRDEAFSFLQTAALAKKDFPEKEEAVLLLKHWENLEI